jgi:DNA-binding transcriptional LysR family regulator
MDNEVRKLTGDVLGPLVIGASTTIGQYVIPRVLGDYQAKFPEVTMRLYVTNTLGVVHMVENNEIDIGIVEGPINNKNLVTEVCWQDELLLVTPPDPSSRLINGYCMIWSGLTGSGPANA